MSDSNIEIVAHVKSQIANSIGYYTLVEWNKSFLNIHFFQEFIHDMHFETVMPLCERKSFQWIPDSYTQQCLFWNESLAVLDPIQ
jgi:hypothetical protein